MEHIRYFAEPARARFVNHAQRAEHDRLPYLLD